VLIAIAGLVGSDFLFDKGIPLVAGRAFSQPFWGLMAAVLTKKREFHFFQWKALFGMFDGDHTFFSLTRQFKESIQGICPKDPLSVMESNNS
jgi:hypothetical protein